MLPFNGLEGVYIHGFKAEPVRSSYFNALISIQQAYLTSDARTFQTKHGPEKQRGDKWRHGKIKSAPLLGPTLGWVKIPVGALQKITEEEIAAEIERSGKQVVSFRRLNSDPEGEMFRPLSGEARTFQVKFRAGALQIWGAACAISGATCLLEAAHIKSVSACKAEDASGLADYFNSIILNVALHALLDEGLIAFSDKGELLVSRRLGARDRNVFRVSAPISVTFDDRAIKYIQFHRENVFR